MSTSNTAHVMVTGLVRKYRLMGLPLPTGGLNKFCKLVLKAEGARAVARPVEGTECNKFYRYSAMSLFSAKHMIHRKSTKAGCCRMTSRPY